MNKDWTDDFKTLLAASFENERIKRNNRQLPNDIAARRLLDAFADLTKKHDFKPGDLVELKPGLGGYQEIPKHGQPGIVTEIIDPPIIADKQDAGSPAFGMTHDIRIMFIVSTEHLHIEYAFDSRLFLPYTGEIA